MDVDVVSMWLFTIIGLVFAIGFAVAVFHRPVTGASVTIALTFGCIITLMLWLVFG